MTALSLPAARALHLAAQGLLTAPRRKARPADVLATIRRMALLQIDTISVVARSPYLVLWSRLGDYQQQWLDDALAEGQLFEYWAHEACFLPIEDYGLLRHRMVDPEQLGWKSATQWRREHPGVVERVLQHIQQQGAMRSADFEQPEGHQAGWWNWKPEKRALEVLFASGELMVARRQGFQRVYDLRERVLPDWQDAQHLQPVQDCKRQLVLQAVKALGVAHPGWVADYYRMGRLEAELQPATLASQGLLLQATLTESGDTVYIHPDHAELLDAALAGTLQARGTRILSPFDPVVWDRKRANALFQFDYRLECYTPAPKRQYGYFVLPILRNGALIGRMDAKAHRQQGRMEVKALHLEAGVRASQGLARDLVRTMLEFARWHATPEVQLSGALPDRLAPLLHAELASQA
ncbi:winged helix-turn-helix domain-containing protein [Leeia sp.]|uniref:winged helix-turn-helix domain-containing protein n=1 Tax=Leeia sp. TaxID=2884678 RepID=UPI0035B3028C